MQLEVGGVPLSPRDESARARFRDRGRGGPTSPRPLNTNVPVPDAEAPAQESARSDIGDWINSIISPKPSDRAQPQEGNLLTNVIAALSPQNTERSTREYS